MNGNKTVLVASLFGNKIAEKAKRLAMVNSQLADHVLPPVPFVGRSNTSQVEKRDVNFTVTDGLATPPNIENQFFPLMFRRRKTLSAGDSPEPWYTFPYEPLISINGKNILVKKAPAKANGFIGTVKERWSQDDYEITITGSIIGSVMTGSAEEAYPRADFEKLRDYCTSPEGLEVRCEPLQLLGVNYLVIEDFSFPFTNGENVQAYELKGYSDFSSDLLLEID